MTDLALSTWPQLAPGTFIRLPRNAIANPAQHGFRASVGWPRGQQADYRRTLPDGSGLHLQDFGTHWELHRDRVDPAQSVVQHMFADLPGVSVLVGACLGAAAGASQDEARAGAVLGGCMALLGVLSAKD